MSAKASDTVVVRAFGKYVGAFAITLTPEEKAGVLKLAEILSGFGVMVVFV